MLFQEYSQVELLQGLFGLIWVIIALLIGIRIILKGASLERKDLIFVGFNYVFLSSAWWGVAFQFLFLGNLSQAVYLFIANFFIGWGLICWTYAFCDVFYPSKKVIFVVLSMIFAIVWDIFLLYSLTNDPDMIATFTGIFDTNHTLYSLLFIATSIMIFMVSGIVFSYKFIKTDNPEIKIKGWFLLIAWISFTIAAVMDSAVTMTILLVVIVRILLISTAVEYYFGFFLPKALSNRLIK